MAASALISLVSMKFKPTTDAVVNFPENIIKLEMSFPTLQAVVDDAERKQGKNKEAQIWISRLKEMAYDVDDLLDERNTEMQREKKKEKERENEVATSLCMSYASPLLEMLRWLCIFGMTSYAYNVVPFFTRNHIFLRVDKIVKQLERIVKDKDQFQTNAIDEFQSKLEPRPETSSFVDTAGIFGREEEKKIILSKLLSEGSSQVSHVPVISIVGTGGFGKTTLSQFVFNDHEVVAKFEKKMWVCVSQPFDKKKVAKEIIGQAGGNVLNSDGWQSLHRSLCEAVKEKLFFLVLDDVWGYKDELWRELKCSLDGGSPGSRILITTRNETVAQQMSSSYICRLKGLSDDDCWELFRHRALQGEKDPEKFEKIGKEISKKCKGVPLAARFLSSLMSSKKSEQDWRDVLDSSIWDVREDDGNGVQLRPELLLSYYALPPPMKQCFVYCAMFPEDTTMEKDYVVKLWMAEGFIADDGTNNLEKIGASYFNGLAMRSFFQDFTMDNGSLVGCKMHDLVRDFALFLMHGSEKSEKKPIMRYLYRLEEEKEPSPKQLQRLRTLIIPPDVTPIKESVYLRVLHLMDLGTCSRISPEVGHLLHLRYLGLNGRGIKELPESVCDLINLQTLNLDYCENLRSLPKRIGELSNLRHLQLEGTDQLKNIPESIGELGLLRTLCKFIVGPKSDSLKIGGLKRLSHLQGHLEITGLENIANVNEVFKADLKMKKNIRSLEFVFFGYNYEDEDEDADDEMRDDDKDLDRHIKKMEKILNGLEPPEGLKELTIRSYLGREFPFRISSLSNLVKLQFYGCFECVSLPCLGNLAFLEEVELSGFSSVERLGKEFYGVSTEFNKEDLFPRLKTLSISDMDDLIEWEFPFLPNNQKIMPLLSVLRISNCRKLSVLPIGIDVFSNLVELHISSCHSLRTLPALGGLKNLESLCLSHLGNVKRVGSEFLGMSNSDDTRTTSFPKLKSLKFESMPEWEEWEVPFHDKKTEFFPKLTKIEIRRCPRLKALPALGKLNSLEHLILFRLDGIKHMGTEFLGISSNGDGTQDVIPTTLFPKLTSLIIRWMDKWEGEEEIMEIDNQGLPVMPSLERLTLASYTMLKVIPRYMFSSALKTPKMEHCSRGTQPCLPSRLEELELNEDHCPSITATTNSHM